MAFLEDNPNYRIDNAEQATKRIRELVGEVVQAREACDVLVPGVTAEMKARVQRQNYRRWMVKYGQAIGTLVAFHQCGRLSDEAYNKLRAEVQQTLQPTVTGTTPLSIVGP